MALTDYELVPAARRTLNIFLMVDKSGSMAGEKIAAVNDAMRNIIPIIGGISESNPDAEIKISVVSFSNCPEWITPKPQKSSEIKWTDLSAGGMTALGESCIELNRQLSHKHGFLNSPSGSYAPVVILLSDGEPTDDFNAGIATLEENAWFKHAIRIAIAIGNDADIDVLKTFTGNLELVFRVHNIDALKTAIRVAIVTSSTISSRSSSVTSGGGTNSSSSSDKDNAVPPTKAQMTAEAINEELSGEFGIDVGDEALMQELDVDEFN